MWLPVVYCVGVFMACQGASYTESDPYKGFPAESREKCVEDARRMAATTKARYPDYKIEWTCLDRSSLETQERKK